MKGNDKLEKEKSKKVHYFFIGKNEKSTLKKLDQHLHFFRVRYEGKFKGLEIVYDVPNNMLTGAGLVLSKQYEDTTAFFKVRKMSTLPSAFKRPSQKFYLGQCEDVEAPKDYPVQIANAISNSFPSSFTIDLVSIVRQTVPKIEISVKGKKYRIISGTGYEADLLYEVATYKDLEGNNKVKKPGMTLKLPADEKYEKENQEILDVVDHYCKELVPYEHSRFEMAMRLLFPKPIEVKTKELED